jgi:serine/threonine protein kinase
VSVYETFGKYKLTERLAFGGMAEVFLGTVHGAAGFVKPVVIKRLHPRLSEDNDFVQMLIDEARITAQLTHGNICQVLDLGAVDNSYYIAMEFIAGEDLRTLQDACMRHHIEVPIPAAIYIVSEVLAGLDYAHRKEAPDGTPLGIIHRDISPQNVLVSYEGEVKIIDFGIAKARDRVVQTQAGIIKGKFRYMAPEQASGEAMDHRVDLFAAGVVLYELLRGSPHAPDLSDTEVLRKMRRAEFEPLSRVRPDLPKEIDTVVRKALGRRPRDRYASCAEFRTKLLNFLQAHKIPYGRTELAGLMRQNFDEDRRRRRSGSFAGPMVQVGSGSRGRGVSSAQAPRSDTEILDQQGSSSGSGSVSMGGRARSAAAYAPTTASMTDQRVQSGELSTSELELSLGDVMEVVDEVAPLRLPDSERTLTYTPPIDHDEAAMEARVPTAALNVTIPEMGKLQVEPPDPSLPTAEMQHPPGEEGRPIQRERTEPQLEEPLHRQQTERHAGEPLHRQQTERRDARESRSQSGEGSRGATKGPRAGARQSSMDVPLPRASTHPTSSTDLFSSRGETQRDQDVEKGQQREASRRSRLRTLIGLGVVLLLGGGVVAALVLSQGTPPPERLDAGGPAWLRRLVDGAAAPDAGGGTTTRVLATLKVRSKPAGGAIRYCGKPTGLVTPANLTVQPGRRCALEIELPGYAVYRDELSPTPGIRFVNATLKRGRSDGVSAPRGGTGTLRVTSIQVGTVYVNDQAMGRTPQLELKLAPGTYSVRMHFPALEIRTQTRTIKVVAGRTIVTHFDPQP